MDLLKLIFLDLLTQFDPGLDEPDHADDFGEQVVLYQVRLVPVSFKLLFEPVGVTLGIARLELVEQVQFGAKDLVDQQIALNNAVCRVLKDQDVSHADLIGGGARHPGVVRVVVHDVDHHVVPLVLDVRHLELVVACLVAAVCEAGHIFPLDPDFRAAKFFGQPRHLFERGRQVG